MQPNTPAANSQPAAQAFTPGPWKHFGSQKTQTLCGVDKNGGKEYALRIQVTGDNHLADARLIAAAPELFQQLREARSILNSCGFEEPPDEAYKKSWDDALARIDAAIAAVQS